MKSLARFLLMGLVFFILFIYFSPGPTPKPTHAEPHTETVTLAEVSAKSQDAFVTTAHYMGQEKARLSANMAITLHKLDTILKQLNVALASVSEEERPGYRRQIEDWQGIRHNVVQLQGRIRPAENSTLDHLKAQWRQTEVNISGRLLSQQESERTR